METRGANPEGKGEVSMLDLVVNALRMRPDRIIVGEIRRKREAEVLFEAIHTGHSVYATLHANTVEEAVIRLTTDPIGVSETLLGALDLMVVQNRNRRTNQRRTFQIAEMMTGGDYNLLYNYDFGEDELKKANEPEELYRRLRLFSGMDKEAVQEDIDEKVRILQHLVEEEINSIEEIGRIISHYYTDKDYLLNTLFNGND
jgi:flagellar protein FlaI